VKIIKSITMKVMMTVAALLMSSQALARGGGDGFLLGINTMYSTSNDDLGDGDGSTESSIKSTKMDLNLGYQMSSGLYLGLLYINDSFEVSGVKGTTTGYGPGVGYMKNGWFVHGHYILSAQKDDDTSDTSKWTKGTGLQMDLGYSMEISGPFHLGLGLSYRSLEYSTADVAGVEITTNKRKITEMDPKIRFTFLF